MVNEAFTKIQIEKEQPDDIDGIRQVNLAAFDGSGEADVVDQLRAACPNFLSLVAKSEGSIVGHILFTPVQIVKDAGGLIEGMGLAPMAVLPDYQGRGIGSALVREGLRRLDSANVPFVIVLGHPSFYPRFGFERASKFNVRSSYENVPDDVFMIHIFDTDRMAGVSGTAYYQPEFDQVT